MADASRVHMDMWGRVVVEVELDYQTIETGDPGHTKSLRSDCAVLVPTTGLRNVRKSGEDRTLRNPVVVCAPCLSLA